MARSLMVPPRSVARPAASDGDAPAPFRSFFMGGFECSTQRLRTGRRLDMIAATRHDELCESDYGALVRQGILTAREGLRWHLIESAPGRYDFASAAPMVKAARATGVQIIWDLCHYGWPDDLDLFRPEFVRRFTRFVTAFARWLRNETDSPGLFTPINEISYLAWAAGDVGYLNPFERERGFELKAQLVRAAIEAMEAVRAVLPQARFTIVDPLINVIADPERPACRAAARSRTLSQFQAWDMLAGRCWPQLGGDPKYLDLIGVNFYPSNQWLASTGRKIRRGDPLYRPFSRMVREVHRRYGRPLFIAETGTEGAERPGWLRYVCDEARTAQKMGVPIQGVCLYPILNHPGWDNNRYCPNGLWGYADKAGKRSLYLPLARELERQQAGFQEAELSAEEEEAAAPPPAAGRRCRGAEASSGAWAPRQHCPAESMGGELELRGAPSEFPSERSALSHRTQRDEDMEFVSDRPADQ